MESLQPSFATIAYRNQDWISWIIVIVAFLLLTVVGLDSVWLVLIAAAFGVYRILSARMGNAVSTLAAVFIGVVIYVIMVFLTRSIKLEELSSAPGFRRLSRIFRK